MMPPYALRQKGSGPSLNGTPWRLLTASVSEPDPATPKPARIGTLRSGSLTLAVQSDAGPGTSAKEMYQIVGTWGRIRSRRRRW
jgi:hypothetical protein